MAWDHVELAHGIAVGPHQTWCSQENRCTKMAPVATSPRSASVCRCKCDIRISRDFTFTEPQAKQNAYRHRTGRRGSQSRTSVAASTRPSEERLGTREKRLKTIARSSGVTMPSPSQTTTKATPKH